GTSFVLALALRDTAFEEGRGVLAATAHALVLERGVGVVEGAMQHVGVAVTGFLGCPVVVGLYSDGEGITEGQVIARFGVVSLTACRVCAVVAAGRGDKCRGHRGGERRDPSESQCVHSNQRAFRRGFAPVWTCPEGAASRRCPVRDEEDTAE